jgi:hypothetical protein
MAGPPACQNTGVYSGPMNTAMFVLTAICAIGAIVASVPVIVGWWRNRKKEAATNSAPPSTAKWWLVMGVATITLVFSSIGLYRIFQPAGTSPENVEENIKAWADEFQLGVTMLPPDPNIDLGLVITTRGGSPIEIRRTKQNPTYLQMQSNLVLSADHQKKLAALTEEQSEFVSEELSLELARTRMGFTIVGPPAGSQPQIQIVVLSKGMPISGLTELAFSGYIDEMDSAIRVSQMETSLLLDHGSPSQLITKPNPTGGQ